MTAWSGSIRATRRKLRCTRRYLDVTNPALFSVVCADNCERLHFLVPFDAALAQATSDRAVHIIEATRAGELLPRITEDPSDWRCDMCSHKARCWEAGSMMELPPDIRAGGIVADPPLAFQTRSPKGEGRSPQHHYACLSLEQLTAIPIARVAAPDCFLFLWIPLRSVFVVEPLMRAWGFAFSGVAFSWAKQNRSGVGWFMGTGYGTRHNVEVCWLGRRGSPRRKSAGVRELIIAPVRQHSRKPDEVYWAGRSPL